MGSNYTHTEVTNWIWKRMVSRKIIVEIDSIGDSVDPKEPKEHSFGSLGSTESPIEFPML
jgi:hypothetical protein